MCFLFQSQCETHACKINVLGVRRLNAFVILCVIIEALRNDDRMMILLWLFTLALFSILLAHASIGRGR